MTSAQVTTEKLKIFFINSDFHLHQLKFVEETFISDPMNHLIMNDY